MFAGEPDVRVQLRGTLFDQNRQHFFGRTWQSSLQKMNSKISFNEVRELQSPLTCQTPVFLRFRLFKGTVVFI